ncbi:unnamed protein product [Auanema sp. JU1783]|nr:unnamed protein product [Auanema sp. JU1783]
MILLYFLTIFLTVSSVEVEDICLSKPRKLDEVQFHVDADADSSLNVFVYHAQEYSPLRAFSDVLLITNFTDENDCNIYQGASCTDVLDEYHQYNILFGYWKKIQFWRNHRIYPFNTTYIGIDSNVPYSVNIQTFKVNYFRVAIFIGSIALFLFSSSLVRNSLFYYSSGCSMGVLASVLIVAFLVYRVAPKKTIGIPILVGGWSVSLWLLHFLWSNFASLVVSYQKYVAGYFIAALLISFAICYKKGPPTDARSHDIAQWTLQLIAAVAIYFSCQVPEVSFAVIGVLVFHELTKSWLFSACFKTTSVLSTIWRKLFPIKPRLLSMEEYETQMRETTDNELKKLQKYIRSPDVNAWKLTKSVRNPQKLARFANGEEDHVSDEELFAHERDGDILERHSEGLDTEEATTEEWEEEIIYRRTPKTKKGGLSTSTSIRLSRGVSARILAEKLGASAGQIKTSSRLNHNPKRHSIASSTTGLPPKQKSKNPPNDVKLKSRSKRHDRSDFYSSDSDPDYESENIGGKSELSEDDLSQ